jgi:hypothetical protein
MYSKGIEIFPGKEAEDSRLPGDEDIRIIGTVEAKQLFGTGASVIDGVTVRAPYLLPQPPQPTILTLVLR